MTIPVESHIEALIFDCDGTLADTMPLHYRAWTETLNPLGIDFLEDQFYALGGASTVAIVRHLSEQTGIVVDVEHVSEAKEIRARELMPEVEAIPVVFETARHFRNRLPMAVASGGNRPTVDNTLRLLDVTHWFDTIVTADDVAHAKPAPDLFLEAARHLGIAPDRCQVFEDTDLGLEAARRAGMTGTDIRPWR